MTRFIRFYPIFLLYVVISGLIFAGMTTASHPWTYGGPSIFGQTFMVGSTAENLAHGRGLVVCGDAMGTQGNPICYHAARMPIASATLALGAILFGDRRPEAIVFFKNILFFVPFCAAVGVTLWQARSQPRVLLLCTLLLSLPLVMLVYTGTVVDVDAEECYLYGVLGLCFALLWSQRETAGWLVTFALATDLLYLCKSSMLGVFLVLALAALLQARSWKHRALLALLLAMAPLGWGWRQHASSGRFSLGTSLDGINLAKGNNARFKDRYPTVSGVLDNYDSELSRGVHYKDEWQFNDYQLNQARAFVRERTAYVIQADALKAQQMFFTLNRHARSSYGQVGTAAVEGGFVLFRLLLWISAGYALYSAFSHRGGGRFLGVTYLFFLLAYYAPYIAGFGYMRHIIVPALPAVVFLSFAVIARSKHISSLSTA